MIEIATYISAFLSAYIGVEFLRRWIVRKEILDIPNERSSHSAPTPRGGGLVIVLVSLSLYTICSIFLMIEFRWSYFIGALLIASISWVDDLVSVSFVWRFPVHSAAALLVILDLGYWHQIYVPFLDVFDFGLWGSLITFCWIVWLTNAFNFMDGIDGIAGLQAVTAGIGWLVIGTMLGVDSTALYGGILAFASLGFLIHNWLPAKIFMGDVGSAYLGFNFAVLPLLPANHSDPVLPTISILLVFCFLFDTLFTFAKRLFKRERVWEAHQQHIYQRMIFSGYSHKQVAILYGIVSLVVGIAATWMIVLIR